MTRAFLACLALAACTTPDPFHDDVSRQSPVVPLDTGVVRIETPTDTFRVRVEIAETHEQKRIGLMERSEMADDEGMLFVYDEEQPPGAAFHMFRTRIPLDIAFMDDDGRIVAILQMEPCTSPVARFCDLYEPGVPYSSALEVNRGYFQPRGVEIGDRIVLEAEAGDEPNPDASSATRPDGNVHPRRQT